MDTKQVYNDNAEKWLRLGPTSLSDFTARAALFDACGDVNGQSVLDLGCGEGYCARELKRRGAGNYVGVDLSANMIEAAKVQDAKDGFGIDYRTANVVDYEPGREFKLCIAVFLFNYLTRADMNSVLATVHAALAPGGRFVFSVPHPFFPFLRTEKAPPFYFDSKGKNYFADVDQQFEGNIWKQDGEPLPVQCVHKTFADYFDGLRAAGFTQLPDVTELTVTPKIADTNPDFFSPLLNEPLHVLFRVRK